MRSPKAKRESRQHAAAQRLDVNVGRTPAEQLAQLERRGHGHCAEAVRIREAQP